MTCPREIAHIASLIGDNSRAAMLVTLMDGLAKSATELALAANISAQTASNHLNKMLTAKLVRCESVGRYKFYQLASPYVADILESIMLIRHKHISLSATGQHVSSDLVSARTCYDHLAGKLGVEIASKMLSKRYLTHNNKAFSISKKGNIFLKSIGIDYHELQASNRQFAKCCLDWTEKQFHIGGALGCAVLDYFLSNRLVLRSMTKSRVIMLTTKGRLWINNNLG